MSQRTSTNNWLVKAGTAMNLIRPEHIKSQAGSPTAQIWEEIETLAGVTESELVKSLAERLRLRLAVLEPEPRALKIIPERLANQYGVVPLRESNQRLVLATCDPLDFSAEQALSFASGRIIEFELAGPRAIERALRAAYVSGDDVEALVAGLDDSLTRAVVSLDHEPDKDVTRQDIEATPLVKLTNLILSDGIRDRASDIHIQPVSTTGVVRYRIDGVMRTMMQLPLNAVTRVISRIKVLGNMDIADRVRPQDGRARLRITGRDYDLRISTIPVSGGEKAVIRILAPATSSTVSDLGLPAHERERIERLLGQRDGVIAVTGPTGSGKTTTLYSALRQLATGETNIVTVEDPVEYRLPGITQMQADVKRGVTFASALRAVLRQDPDIILIGEMRDAETATIGVQAAMTGHLVLATLHTNDAIGTLPRLEDLGIDRNTLAVTLRGALGQRLLRRVCLACGEKVGTDLTENEKRLTGRFGINPVMRAKGCEECRNLGYRGRLPVVEVMVMTPQLTDLIVEGASSAELMRAAVAGGMRPMVQVALDFVKDGLTTLEEVERVLGDTASSENVSAVVSTEDVDTMSSVPTILIADDDAPTRQLAGYVLGTSDYNIVEVENGKQALDYIRNGEPVSLVLLDLDMPEMGGVEVLKALRSDRATAALPIVVLTSADAEAAVMDAGADDYIRKPIEPQRFLARIKAVPRRATL